MSNVVTTTCKDCIWAEYASGTQVGCKFNRLEKFKERGVKVNLKIDTEDKGLVDAPRNHFEIERFCNRCRDSEWGKRYDNPLDTCIVQSAVQFDIIVPILADKNIQEIKLVFDDLIREGDKVNSVHFSFAEGVAIQPYLIQLNEYFADVCPVFYTQAKLLKNFDDKALQLVNHALNKCTGMYYLVIDLAEHSKLPSTWIDMAENWINEELYPVIMVESVSGINGLMVHRRVHTSFGGNTNKSITEKIKKMLEENDIPHAVKSWEN